MKKLFVAMLAVLVMASCGNSNDGGGNANPGQVLDLFSKGKLTTTGGGNANPGQVLDQFSEGELTTTGGGKGNAVEGIDKIISVTETLLKKAEQATRYNNPEIFVSAFEVFVDEAISIKNNYADALSKMSPEEQQKHAGKIQKMQKLLSKADNLDDILNPLQPSASQTRRLENAMKKLKNLD